MIYIKNNFNLEKSLEETENNCPDFQFVEFNFLELSEWQEEYENDNPAFEIDGVMIKHNHDLGDEKLNEVVFNYLKPIVKRLNDKDNFVILLQMLDSSFVEVV